MKRTTVLAGVVMLLGTLAYAGETVVQVYECSRCNKVEQYAEGSFRTHYCTGTTDKPHSKQSMRHIGEQKVKTR